MTEPRQQKQKRAALVVAFVDFRDEEYFIPKEILEKNGVETTTVSSKPGQARGVLGGETAVDALLSDAQAKDFDALVFVGGSGAAGYFENPDALRLCRETLSENKVLAAICIAPAVLAQADCLRGKKATVWSSSFDKTFVKLLKQKGADYQDKAVISDGKIITANGPLAARRFAQAIVDTI